MNHNDVGNRKDNYSLSGLLCRLFLNTAWQMCPVFFHCARSTDVFETYDFENPDFSERDELGGISCGSVCGKTKAVL